MKNRLLVMVALVWALCANAQSKDQITWINDTMTHPVSGKVLEGEYVETTLKNLSVVRFFKSNDQHFYLRFIVTKNFYFDKTDVLEILSGSKSYYAKDTKQFKVSKTAGLYVVEVYPNYLSTLKDEGITGLIFSKAETDFTRQDAHQIRNIATAFYEKVVPGKK